MATKQDAAPPREKLKSVMVRSLEIDQIEVKEGFNVRDMDDLFNHKVADLATSIEQIGLQQPLIVVQKPGTKGSQAVFQVTAGHRRLAAIHLIRKRNPALFDKVPVLVEYGVTEEEKFRKVVADYQTEKLSPLEAARTVKRMREQFGKDNAAIMGALGITLMTLNNLDTLLKAPEPVQELVDQGKMASTEVIKLVREEGPERTQAIAEAAVEKAAEAGKAKATGADVEAAKADPAVQEKADKAGDKPKQNKPRGQYANSSSGRATGAGARRPARQASLLDGAPRERPEYRDDLNRHLASAVKSLDTMLASVREGDIAKAREALHELAQWSKRMQNHNASLLPEDKVSFPLRGMSVADVDAEVSKLFRKGLLVQPPKPAAKAPPRKAKAA